MMPYPAAMLATGGAVSSGGGTTPTYSITISGDPSGQGSSSSFALGTVTFSTNYTPVTYDLVRDSGTDSRLSGSVGGNSASFSVSGIAAGESISGTFVVVAYDGTNTIASKRFTVGAYRLSGS